MTEATDQKKRNYNNVRRMAMCLLRQLGTVTIKTQPVYVVRIPKAILRVPSLRRQVHRALKTVGLSKENLK